LTQSIIVNVKTNIEESNLDNEYSCSSNQIHHEYVYCQVSLFDIKLYVGQSQKLSNKVKIEYFQKTLPESTFVFPTSELNKKKFKFQLSWLDKWLEKMEMASIFTNK